MRWIYSSKNQTFCGGCGFRIYQSVADMVLGIYHNLSICDGCDLRAYQFVSDVILIWCHFVMDKVLHAVL